MLEIEMIGASMDDVRRAYIARVRLEHGRIDSARGLMLANGFEVVALPADQLLTNDGREVLRAHGKAWALRPEIHAQRLAEAMKQARQRDAAQAAQQPQPAKPSSPPAICTSLIDGQLCGGALIRVVVCPRCALGKSGVVATLTCSVCGHVTAVMKEIL